MENGDQTCREVKVLLRYEKCNEALASGGVLQLPCWLPTSNSLCKLKAQGQSLVLKDLGRSLALKQPEDPFHFDDGRQLPLLSCNLTMLSCS